MVESVRLLTPAGVLQTPHLPAAANGPDLARLIIGSEGILGIITQARDDFFIRRTHVLLFDKRQGIDVHREVADRMQKRLGWSAEEKQAQIDRYKFKTELAQHFREETLPENNVHRR